MKTWNERLAIALEHRGFKPADLARAVRVSPVAVSNWVHGHTKDLKGKNLYEVCSVLKIREAWLLDGKGEMDAPPIIDAKKISDLPEEVRSALKCLLELPTSQVLEFAKGIESKVRENNAFFEELSNIRNRKSA